MGLAEEYVKSVWNQRGMNALYPPDGGVKLGDVLEYKGGTYRRRDTIEGLGILRQLDRPLGRPRSDRIPAWGIKSEAGVTIKTKLANKIVPGIALSSLKRSEAGAVVVMKDKDCFVLSMSDIAHKAYETVSQLGPPISRLFFRNRWDTSWIVVTEVWVPKRCTFLASSSPDTQFELKAKSGAKKTGLGEVDLGGKFALVNYSNDSDHFADRDGTVPLFRGHRWLMGIQPAGRRPRLFRAMSDLTIESAGDDFASSFTNELIPVQFDPTVPTLGGTAKKRK